MTRKKVEPSEHQHQAALIQWCDVHKYRVPELGLLFAIPNGGKRSIGVAVKLKAEGVRPGVPDLFLPVPRDSDWIHDPAHGLFVEMKIRGNGTTKEQAQWITTLQERGYMCIVCYTWHDAAHQILEYLGLEHMIDELIGDVARYLKQPRQARQDGSGEAARTKTRGSTSKPEKGAQTRME
jgi:hypothetical protein